MSGQRKRYLLVREADKCAVLVISCMTFALQWQVCHNLRKCQRYSQRLRVENHEDARTLTNYLDFQWSTYCN